MVFDLRTKRVNELRNVSFLFVCWLGFAFFKCMKLVPFVVQFDYVLLKMQIRNGDVFRNKELLIDQQLCEFGC